MSEKELLSQKTSLLQDLQSYKDSINRRWTDIEDAYVLEHTEWRKDKVYERILDGKKGNFKYTRFVPYQLDTFELGNRFSIRASGWWLDKENVPTKWDTLLLPVDNMRLSENQLHKPHPKAKEALAPFSTKTQK